MNTYICFAGGRRYDKAGARLRHLQLKEHANSATLKQNKNQKLVNEQSD